MIEENYRLREANSELAAELAAEREKVENLRTVMIAAAEEISAHGEHHCDEEGYGPVNLLNRLELGIPSEYGYKAGDFNRLHQQLAAAHLANQRLREALTNYEVGGSNYSKFAREALNKHNGGLNE